MQQFYQRHQCTFSSSSVLLCTSLNEKTEKGKEMQKGITTHRGKGRDLKVPGIMSFTLHSHSRSQRMKSSFEQRAGTWRGLARAVDPRYPCSIDYHTLPLLVP